MDTKRAKDIVFSPTITNVTYNGTPVYIEKVNENSGTAYVHPVNLNNRQEVPVDNLVEQQ